MEHSTNVVRLRQPDEIDDPLTEVLRAGARRLLAQAVEMEAEAFLAGDADLRLPDGRARWSGTGTRRSVRSRPGSAGRGVSRPRSGIAALPRAEERVRFTSAILPKWARRTRSLDALLPVLYLRGVSTGDFQEALAALLGKDAPNLSPSVVARLTADVGRPSMLAGRDGTSRRGATSTSGPTASTCRPGWRSRPSACWS